MDELLHVCGGGVGECLEVVSAFEDAEDSAVAGLLCDGGDELREVCVAGGGEVDVAERVEGVRVEAGGEEEELRLVVEESGDDVLGEGVVVVLVVAPGGHGEVEGVAAALADAGFVGEAGVWVLGVGVFMDGDDERVAALFEEVLRAVAVVDVEVDDGDAFELVCGEQVVCGERDVGVEAEAHGAVCLGVVAGRSDGAEGVGELALHDGVGGVEDRADGELGDICGVGADAGVLRVDVGTVRDAGVVEAVEVVGGVEREEYLAGGGFVAGDAVKF